MRSLLYNDIRLQWRQGFWLVYFLVSIVYVLILLNIPADKRLFVSLLLILSDTTMLGIIFIGAVILLEKQQAVTFSLFVTPLKASQYIISKTSSLSLIAITMSILVYIPAAEISWYTILIFLTIIITAAIFVLFGIGIAANVNTINQYFAKLMMFSILILLPAVPYLLLEQHPAFLLLPYIASLDLMLGPIRDISAGRALMDLLLLLGWGLLSYRFALIRVNKYLVYT